MPSGGYHSAGCELSSGNGSEGSPRRLILMRLWSRSSIRLGIQSQHDREGSTSSPRGKQSQSEEGGSGSRGLLAATRNSHGLGVTGHVVVSGALHTPEICVLK
jgi:hypothetical protein